MLKLESLRSLMSSVVPELARDPERLIIMARAGRCKSSGTASLSFEYAYTAQVYVLDWAGAADAIIVPILAWLREQQIEQFDNPARWPEQLRFSVELLNDRSIDLHIEVDLTERVLVRQRPGGPPGQLEMTHVPEPGRIGVVDKPEHWSLWLREQLLAEWDFDPRPQIRP